MGTTTDRPGRGKGKVKSWGKNGQRQEKVVFLNITKAEGRKRETFSQLPLLPQSHVKKKYLKRQANKNQRAREKTEHLLSALHYAKHFTNIALLYFRFKV